MGISKNDIIANARVQFFIDKLELDFEIEDGGNEISVFASGKLIDTIPLGEEDYFEFNGNPELYSELHGYFTETLEAIVKYANEYEAKNKNTKTKGGRQRCIN